eukprot:1501995-Amphidinium_carterae.1
MAFGSCGLDFGSKLGWSLHEDFCVELLHRHPLKRVSAEEALALPFITGADQPLPRFENGRQTL